MNKLSLILTAFIPFLLQAQIKETFSDGNYTENPSWTGTTDNFLINSLGQLQLSAKGAGISTLFTKSEAIENAIWECWIKINYNPTSYNYSCFYICSDKNEITNGCNGYYVQVGGSKKEIALYLQEGTRKTKIIDGIDNRVDKDTVTVSLRITRDNKGNFILYSKLADENDFYQEGYAQDSTLNNSTYSGILVSNTTGTTKSYFFDNINVSGQKTTDKFPPLWDSLEIVNDKELALTFSEPVSIENGEFKIQQDSGLKIEKIIKSADEKKIYLIYPTSFEKGKLYTLKVNNVVDKAGNKLLENIKSTGFAEKREHDDIALNEIMFNQPVNGSEYIEIVNKTGKLLNCNGLIISTVKSSGELICITRFPENLWLEANAYLAIGENAEAIRKNHEVPLESHIAESKNWYNLNNESGTLILTNSTNDTVFDRINYDATWHNGLIKNNQGISLERINPLVNSLESNSWHSSSYNHNYGTPGFINSQYINNSEIKNDHWCTVITEAFSPDNDGIDDICQIEYQMGETGYIGNLWILNSTGETIKKLLNNRLLETSGELFWDGKTSSGKEVNMGIYIICFEAFNPNDGTKKTVKKAIAVSRR